MRNLQTACVICKSHALSTNRMRYLQTACVIRKPHAFFQVMNLNKAPAASVGLVAYLPELEVSNTLKDLDAYKPCKHYLLQQCIGHILSSIESRARYGFKACIAGIDRILFPRLGAMSLDTKERVKYFGLR